MLIVVSLQYEIAPYFLTLIQLRHFKTCYSFPFSCDQHADY